MDDKSKDSILSNDPALALALSQHSKVNTKPDDPNIPWTPYAVLPGIDGIGAMLKAAKQPVNWILENLLEEGDQLLIGGPPKTGKSLCSLQIALAVASGGDFLEWQAQKPRRVLYVNLEIKKRVLGDRILRMVGGEDKIHNYSNLYCMNVNGRIDIMDPAQAQKFMDAIRALDVDLVVWDVLARMHTKDEMTTEMLEVMNRICKVSLGRANIVVHHTRKPPADNTAPQTAHDLRGSGAIFGECDGAFVISRRKHTIPHNSFCITGFDDFPTRSPFAPLPGQLFACFQGFGRSKEHGSVVGGGICRGGIGRWASEQAADPIGGYFCRQTDGQHPRGLLGLGGNPGGLPFF